MQFWTTGLSRCSGDSCPVKSSECFRTRWLWQINDHWQSQMRKSPTNRPKCSALMRWYGMVWYGVQDFKMGVLWCSGFSNGSFPFLPSLRSGIRVRCTAERSQQDNRSKAKSKGDGSGGATGCRKLLANPKLQLLNTLKVLGYAWIHWDRSHFIMSCIEQHLRITLADSSYPKFPTPWNWRGQFGSWNSRGGHTSFS